MSQKKYTIFKYLYWGYMCLSIVASILSVVLLIRLYIFSIDETTIADIFLLVVMMLIGVYFRINAFHYENNFRYGSEFI